MGFDRQPLLFAGFVLAISATGVNAQERGERWREGGERYRYHHGDQYNGRNDNRRSDDRRGYRERDDRGARDDSGGRGFGMGQGGMGQGGMGQGGMGQGGMGQGRYAMIDQNHDGVISADEAAAHFEQVFAELDTNDDDTVTREEFVVGRPDGGRGSEIMRTRREERFLAMDTDKDSKLGHAEFLDAHKVLFIAADTDKDGKVTPWEFRAQRWRWR
ncbi:MAG: EF-hand domain-containing protein [Beijerinckiaceae bacterium]